MKSSGTQPNPRRPTHANRPTPTPGTQRPPPHSGYRRHRPAQPNNVPPLAAHRRKTPPTHPAIIPSTPPNGSAPPTRPAARGTIKRDGAVAQLVERIVRNDEVGSSTLLRSTSFSLGQSQGIATHSHSAEKSTRDGFRRRVLQWRLPHASNYSCVRSQPCRRRRATSTPAAPRSPTTPGVGMLAVAQSYAASTSAAVAFWLKSIHTGWLFCTPAPLNTISIR